MMMAFTQKTLRLLQQLSCAEIIPQLSRSSFFSSLQLCNFESHGLDSQNTNFDRNSGILVYNIAACALHKDCRRSHGYTTTTIRQLKCVLKSTDTVKLQQQQYTEDAASARRIDLVVVAAEIVSLCLLCTSFSYILVCIQALESFICVLFTGNDNNYKKNFSVEMFV